MKAFKKLTCLLVSGVLLFFSVGLIKSSAIYDVFFTSDDLIDIGYEYDGDGDFYYLPVDSYFNISTYYAAEKNYPDFDIKSIPWTTFPSYITDIVYSDLTSLSKTDFSDGTYKVPFVMVAVGGSGYNIYVGYNVGLGMVNTSYMSLNIFSSPSSAGIYDNSCLYTARFGSTGNVWSDWTKCEPIAYGDKGNLVSYFSSNLANTSSVVDYYFYGANGLALATKYSSIVYFYSSSNTSLGVSFPLSTSGFFSGKYFTSGVQYNYIYCETFTPATFEQVEQETQKGIWESIKSLPGQIAESIGGFFESLKNYLLYFQDTKPEHVNPFEGILDGIQSFFDEQIGDTEDFKTSLNSTFDNVSGYIETGSNIINKLLSGVPVLNTVLIFFLAFAVIRKVVGR